MAITRIGSAAGAGNTLTMPAHQAGDLLLMFAYRDGSTTPPVLRDGWTNVLNGGSATNSCRVAYKIAESSSEIADSWGTASSLICAVYRADGTIGVGASARSSAASTTISYPALTLNNTDGTSWVVGFGGHRSIDTAVETPPTGMTNLISVLDGTDEAAAHDTNGPVSSWSLQTVSVGGTSSGWNGATVEITEVAPPTPPAGDNPATIMASASEVDLFFDAALSDLFQDTAATTAATADGDPVNFIAALWGNDFVAGASSGRNAVLRLPGGDDPYLEAVPGSSQLRASIARSGDLYVICRGRWNGTANDQEAFWTLTNNASQFYTGNFMVPRYFPFGFNYIQTETSVGYAVTTAAVAITRGAWSTLEIWVSGSTIYTAVDGGTPETYAASGPLGDTTLMDIFGSLDGGVTGSFAVDIRRLAVLNDIPDSTERANLLDWAENGDAGGGPAPDPVNATGDVSLAISVSGAADAAVAGAGAGSIEASMTGAAAARVAASGAVSLDLSGSGMAAAFVAAVGDAALGLTGSGSASLSLGATGGVTLPMAVDGAAVVAVTGAGAVSITPVLAGAGLVGEAAPSIEASGGGTLSIGAAGSAVARVVGAGGADISISASGAAEAFVEASGAGSLVAAATGAARVAVAGAGGGAFAISVTGEAQAIIPPIEASGAVSLPIAVSGAADADVRGSGSVGVTAAASGSARSVVRGAGAVGLQLAASGAAFIGAVSLRRAALAEESETGGDFGASERGGRLMSGTEPRGGKLSAAGYGPSARVKSENGGALIPAR